MNNKFKKEIEDILNSMGHMLDNPKNVLENKDNEITEKVISFTLSESEMIYLIATTTISNLMTGLPIPSNVFSQLSNGLLEFAESDDDLDDEVESE